MHWSCPADRREVEFFAVEFFFSAETFALSSVYAGCADLSVKELHEHCVNMFVHECHVL